LNIAVLVKQIPESETSIRIANDQVSVISDNWRWMINPFDALAVEEALRIRERHGGRVSVWSVGGKRIISALQTALAMGADEGRLIIDEISGRNGGCDGYRIARILAAGLKPFGFDLIIAGHRAVDDANYFVGPAVAEFLGIPNISMVVKIEIIEGKIRCVCTQERGTVTLESSLPALFTTQRGINEPRTPTLAGVFKARKKPISLLSLEDIGVSETEVVGPIGRVVRMFLRPDRPRVRIIEGRFSREKAVKLIEALCSDSGVI
jgi:electron transfer flavoprotein beta subunit